MGTRQPFSANPRTGPVSGDLSSVRGIPRWRDAGGPSGMQGDGEWCTVHYMCTMGLDLWELRELRYGIASDARRDPAVLVQHRPLASDFA